MRLRKSIETRIQAEEDVEEYILSQHKISYTSCSMSFWEWRIRDKEASKCLFTEGLIVNHCSPGLLDKESTPKRRESMF